MKNIESFVFRNATEAFETLYKEIMSNGEYTNVGTKALYNIGFEITNPEDNIITTEWRKFSKKYAEREYKWYLSGNRSVEDIKKYAPIWDTMHGGDNIVNSNYGWQWNRNEQLEKCIEQLSNDNNSRRAWLTIFDGKEKNQYAYDTPCTLAVGFDISPHDKKLNICVLMRSNDLVFGFCNDQYCWSNLQRYVANRLGLQVGSYYHFAHDMHVYKRHFNMRTDFYKKKFEPFILLIAGVTIIINELTVSIEDSFVINSRFRMRYILCRIKTKYIDSAKSNIVFKRSITSLVNEWAAHNLLYYVGYKKHRTKDVDLDNESRIRRLGYWFLSRLNVVSFIKRW